MLLFGLAALAAFLTLAHRRAEAIRQRLRRQRVDIPLASWEMWPNRPASREGSPAHPTRRHPGL